MSAAIETLADELTGPLLRPGDAAYDEEVAGFNTAVVHRPDVVVGATNTRDVQAALRHATERGLPVAVQATGHGATTPFAGGLLISTRRMNAVRIDAREQTATVAAGARWRAVIDAAAPHGLAPLSGSSSGVGVVGYTAGGGLPVMCRTFGFAADAVRAVELVTADGDVHRLDADREPELFWGICGGKANLGIITAMTIELVPVSTIFGGGIFYAAEHIADVLHAYPGWAATLPETTSTSIAILRLPPTPQVPEPLRGRTVAHLRICHVGDTGDGERLLAPLRTGTPTLVDHVGEMPYTAIDAIHADPDHPVPVCQRGELLHDVTPATIDALLAVAGPDVQAPLVVCELRQMGGALTRGPAAGNAVSGRDAAYCLSAVGMLTPDTAEAAPAALDAVIDAVRRWSTGTTLVNMHGTPTDEKDRARAWEPATYRRLVQLSRRLDPAGLLRHEHAIGRQQGAAPNKGVHDG
jgi:FAD/FMN-containing dehydrogenase